MQVEANSVPSPGARMLIRDAEWIVRSVDTTSRGHRLVCDGVSELVRGREAIFLTELEQSITVLDPADTQLVSDDSAQFSKSLLYIESHLRAAVPNDQRIHVGHAAAMDYVPYQFDPARQALERPRQRILIADAVGLGKTLAAGILVSELMARGRGKRILVLAVKSMLTQFQKEFWNRFTIPLTRLDSIGIQRVRNRIPTNHNPFYYYDKSIISIDTLKQDAEYRVYLEQAEWDIIVIDEAHNVADRGTGSLRNRLAKLLGRRSATLIMLSATPHDGKARSFASLVNMLDPTALPDPDNYTKQDFRPGLVVRRFKKDVKQQVRDSFQEREVSTKHFQCSAAEEAAHEALLNLNVADGSQGQKRNRLFLVTLEKALFSSPAACIESVDKRIGSQQRNIEKGRDIEVRQAEIDGLRGLRAALERISPSNNSKYQALLEAIRGGKPFNWRTSDPQDRLVIFSERIETLRWLEERLSQDLKLKLGQVEILDGGKSDIDQQRIVEDFGNTQKPLRLLLCSDVASEGINLHFQCHRLIHFDLPWSLMTFQQRNGRVDRYGQKATPRIVYLIAESANETIRGDMRILEVLVEKDQQAYDNIGDPSAFMGVFDVDEEEKITETALVEGQSSEAFESKLTPETNEGDDLLNLFLKSGEDTEDEDPLPLTDRAPPPPLSLFTDDLDYCEAALRQLQDTRLQTLGFDVDKSTELLALDAPAELLARFSHLPPEVFPENNRFNLTTSRARMSEAIAESRRSESDWPALHYLWRLNPVVAWLNDCMLAAFNRAEAPVLSGIPGIAANETVFVFSGLVPNRKGHPLVHDWIAVIFRDEEEIEISPLSSLIERTGLGVRPIPNSGQAVDFPGLSALLRKAVVKAQEHFTDCRNSFEDDINVKLNEEIAILDKFKLRRFGALELKFGDESQLQAQQKGRLNSARSDIEEVHDEYYEWIEATMTTEPNPSIKLICAMTPVIPAQPANQAREN